MKYAIIVYQYGHLLRCEIYDNRTAASFSPLLGSRYAKIHKGTIKCDKGWIEIRSGISWEYLCLYCTLYDGVELGPPLIPEDKLDLVQEFGSFVVECEPMFPDEDDVGWCPEGVMPTWKEWNHIFKILDKKTIDAMCGFTDEDDEEWEFER